MSLILGLLQQQANKAWREKENAFKTNCRQFQGRRKKEERPADGRSSGPCASAPSSSDREPVKKGSKSWSTPVCDCLEKETKTVIFSDNSNESELSSRVRSDEATTMRCRKEKLLRLRQRCTCSAVVVDRSPCTSGIVSHFTVPRRCAYVHPACWRMQLDRAAKHSCRNQPSVRPPCMVSNFDRAKARACLPSIGKEGADCRSKGIFLPMGDHGILGSLRRAFSPL